MRKLQVRANPCNTLIITRNEQIRLGPYCLAVIALPSALNSSKLALPSRDARSKHTCASHDWQAL